MTDLLDYPAPDYGCIEHEIWGNKTIADDSGKVVQVRGVRTTPRWSVPLTWSRMAADLAAFLTSLRALKGGQVEAYFYTPSYWAWWDDVAAGTGDGSALVFPFGGRSLQTFPAPVVTVGGAGKVAGSDFEVGIENRILQSENLSDVATWAAQGGATVTRTAGRTDPAGGSTAWRIQTSGGVSTMKLRQTISAPPMTALASGALWIQNNGTKALIVDNGFGINVPIPVGTTWAQVVFPAVRGDGSTPQVLSFLAAAAGDALDFDVWHPWAQWFTAEMATPPAGMLPATTGAYDAGTF